jgi:hypothetical protein
VIYCVGIAVVHNCKWLSGGLRALQGEEQPFYHLIVDPRGWRGVRLPEGTSSHVPVCYAAEELLNCPAFHGSTWAQDHGADEHLADFYHPYEYILFLGKDNHGDYIPTPELSNAYGAQRRDVYPVTESSSDGEGDDDEAS